MVVFSLGILAGVGLCAAVPVFTALRTAEPLPPPPTEDPKLVVSSSWGRDLSSDTVVNVGIAAENISEETLEDLLANVTFWSAAGNVVDTVQAPSDKGLLRPGRVAYWDINVPWKGTMTQGGMTLDFEDRSGRQVPYINRESYF
jgi:hypothetical protein